MDYIDSLLIMEDDLNNANDHNDDNDAEVDSKLGRATSQSKVEKKMAPYRTAAMIFTAILDLEARSFEG